MNKCEICRKHFINITALSRHVTVNHKDITKEEYYIRYLSVTGEKPVCRMCGKPTKFYGLDRGFGSCCSKKCTIAACREGLDRNN